MPGLIDLRSISSRASHYQICFRPSHTQASLVCLLLLQIWHCSLLSWNFQGCIAVHLSRFKVSSNNKWNWRRRRELNPRAASHDLLPFQGSPFGLLGTSPNNSQIQILIWIVSVRGPWINKAERMGFEPMRPCGQTVFKTASLWPLRYLSSGRFF